VCPILARVWPLQNGSETRAGSLTVEKFCVFGPKMAFWREFLDSERMW